MKRRASRDVGEGMQLFSFPKSQFPRFPPSSPNPNPNPNLPISLTKISIRAFSSLLFLKNPPSSSKASSPPPVQEHLRCSESDEENEEEDEEEREGDQKASEQFLAVRRPVKEVSEETVGSLTEAYAKSEGEEKFWSSSKIDEGLTEFAKKIPIFEPERVGVAPKERPLAINLELGLYRAKVLTRNFRFKEAEEILLKCISFWPEDGRPYVALGKLLIKQSKFSEARAVYERGCQATQGENSYIWQCWAVLENKVGNIRRARELFDAATVADKRHIAAWHGWAVLEIEQGNIKKARNLLAKGLKYCGGNEYVYQTLALLEARGKRFKQARYLFRQATKCNPKSCASWLAWAQVEMQQQNNRIARQLFERAVQASPKNRFAWHIWALFEASQGDINKGRKLLKIGHAVNPRDPVILQSLALLEYKHSSANVARVLFRRASELDPGHQPVWVAWGWMEWKEGNINTARELYRRALSIDSTSESAARCLQRTEVVDDASWVMGFLDVIDPALNSIKRLLNLYQTSNLKGQEILRTLEETNNSTTEASDATVVNGNDEGSEDNASLRASDFDLDAFIRDKLSLDVSALDELLENFQPRRNKSSRRIWRSGQKNVLTQP
ncbi:protein high chlorophyll fluorescent 107 isoform X2 [Phoenix dactylifera]|uniref:Protein high chlorophyll fluorescent 107 isoform X2 n=1 Tax=Phoenix dactylifera TaxID=42345 RepID=A0A8B9A996_PHODC|nr:protein high chlorophyll fluorescent 107 isoform X2 [Phoenix dactylifera]